MVYSTEQKAFMTDSYFRNCRKVNDESNIICKNFSFPGVINVIIIMNNFRSA
jgi:hypothetical protein